MFISSWGCADVLFEGVTQYAFWSVAVFEVRICTDISLQNKRAATCVQTSANPAIHVQSTGPFVLFSTIIHGQRGELFSRCEWSAKKISKTKLIYVKLTKIWVIDFLISK